MRTVRSDSAAVRREWRLKRRVNVRCGMPSFFERVAFFRSSFSPRTTSDPEGNPWRINAESSLKFLIERPRTFLPPRTSAIRAEVKLASWPLMIRKWHPIAMPDQKGRPSIRLGDFAALRWRFAHGRFLLKRFLHFPDSIKLNEIGLYRNIREGRDQQLACPQQFGAMMLSLSIAVALEMSKAAISGAIRVAHHHHALRLVQPDRHADLLKNEILLEVVTRRSQRLSSPGHDNHVNPFNFLLLQKLSDDRPNAMIKAAKDGRVGHVGIGGRIEVENLLHKSVYLF